LRELIKSRQEYTVCCSQFVVALLAVIFARLHSSSRAIVSYCLNTPGIPEMGIVGPRLELSIDNLVASVLEEEGRINADLDIGSIN
jgi:hypothetical protein